MRTILLKPMRGLIEKHYAFHEFEDYQSIYGKVVALQIFYFKHKELPAENILQRLEKENLKKLLEYTSGGRQADLHDLIFRELLSRVAPENGPVYHAELTELLTILDPETYARAMSILSFQSSEG